MKKAKLRSAEMPELVVIVESFKDAMKKKGKKWKKMGFEETVEELQRFVAELTREGVEQQS